MQGNTAPFSNASPVSKVSSIPPPARSCLEIRREFIKLPWLFNGSNDNVFPKWQKKGLAMLKKDTIPSSEPVLDVGMVLPEDGISQLTLTLPAVGEYLLIPDAGVAQPLAVNQTIIVERSGEQFIARLPSGGAVQAGSLQIAPAAEDGLAPQSGVRVQNLVAGRSFHWRKEIANTLPGTLLFRIVDGAMVLINRLWFEHYLACVATSEMGAACPPALIEAQTIAARSWMLANVEQKHRALGMDVCNDDCCQRYQGSTFLTEHARAGASATRGQVLMFAEKICDARYSKSCGGFMEAFDAVWDGEAVPYLQVKWDGPAEAQPGAVDLQREKMSAQWLHATPAAFCSPHAVPEPELSKYLGGVDESGHYFRWQFSQSQAELTRTLNRTLSLQARAILALQPRRRGGSGRIMEMAIEYEDATGAWQTHVLQSEYAIRAALHEKFLYSSALVIETEPAGAAPPQRFHFYGGGWGHGVGLCQIGALGMALRGYDAESILLHYYPGARLEKVYG